MNVSFSYAERAGRSQNVFFENEKTKDYAFFFEAKKRKGRLKGVHPNKN